MKRRRFSREFKVDLVQQLENGASPSQLSREYGVHVNLLHQWREAYRRDPEKAFPGNGNLASPEAKIAQLERTVGQLYAENQFLKKTLAWLRQLEETLTRSRFSSRSESGQD